MFVPSLKKCLSMVFFVLIMFALSGQLQAAEVVVLPNGLTVVVQEDERFPVVSMRLYVRAGSAYETAGQGGLSHLLEHMVFKSTEKRGLGGVSEDVESAGGYLNAYTTIDHTCYVIDLPADNWKIGLDVLRDMIFGARIDKKELEEEKKVVISELDIRDDDPQRILFDLMQPQLFKGTPYAGRVIGSRESVRAISREQIKNYIKSRYQPANMLISVCGPVKASDVVDEVGKLFGDLRNSGLALLETPYALPAADGQPVIIMRKGDWNKVYFTAAFPLADVKSPDVPGLELLGQILGGDESSRFYRKFMYDLRLVDDISVSLWTMEHMGGLFIEADLPADKLPAFWTALLKELSSLGSAAFSGAEIERARFNLTNSLFMQRETVGSMASSLGMNQFFHQNVYEDDHSIQSMALVASDDLRRLALKYLRPGRMNVVVLEPESSRTDSADLLKTLHEFWPAAPAEPTVSVYPPDGRTVPAGAPEVIDLGQGRKLVLLPDRNMPYLSVDMSFQGGLSLLAPDKQGLSNLAAAVLTKGTDKRGANEIEDFLSDRASSLTAGSGRDYFFISAYAPKNFSGDVLVLLQETIEQPKFAGAEMERQRDAQIAAIRAELDDPTAFMIRHTRPFLFPHSYYGYVQNGSEESVRALSRKDLTEFWRMQRAMPWTMAVSGDFDREEIIKAARALAGLSTAGQPPRAVEPQWNSEHRLELNLPGRNQLHLLVVFPAPGEKDPDAPAFALLNSLLSRMSGILFTELREKKNLAYSTAPILVQGEKAGFLALYIGTTPDKAPEALRGFKEIVTELRDKNLPAADLKKAADYMRGIYYRGHQSLDSRSSEAAILLSKGYGLDYNRQILAKAAEVTPAQLREAIRRYLDWDQAYIVKVAP